jgi:hypothetical protein
MYNQALILIGRVLAAEEYTMARHPLPPMRTSSQYACDFDGASRRSTALEQRQPAILDAEPIARKPLRPEMP